MDISRPIVPFTKMHALGNDFVALNGFSPLPVPSSEWPALATAMCDRHFGVGADGLFIALPSSTADVRMAFYNPDGTEDRCGNGLRCFGRFLHDERLTDKTSLQVDTYGGPVALSVHLRAGIVGDVTVDLVEPVLEPDGIPMRWPHAPALNVPIEAAGHTWKVSVASTGTPHAIIVVDHLPDDDVFLSASPAIETHPIFPEKITVLWTRFTSPESAEMRIWERAVGETLGCGTGAAAVAVVGGLLGLTDGAVNVRSKGGDVVARWDGRSVSLCGPANSVYKGRFRL